MNHEALATYLRDHATGAGTVTEVVERRIARGDGPEFLERFLAELRGELEVVRDLLERLDSGSTTREALGWAAEKAGQVKLKVDAATDEALRDLLELELMTVGVEGKRRLWISLREMGPAAVLAGLPLDALETQALEQLQALEPARRAAARRLR